MITRVQTQAEINEEINDQEGQEQRDLNQLPTFEHQTSAPAGGPVTDIEMARHLAKMIRQFLLGYTLEEVEAMAKENVVEGAENRNLDIHYAAEEKLRELADKFDPPSPQMVLRSLVSKTPSLPYLMPALRRPIR